jgi:hypothetical protein
MSVPTYFYNSQLATYFVQFMAIFQLLKVKTGKQANGEPTFINVPVEYGSKDRVAVAIKNDNTQNLPMRLPRMSAYMTELKVSPLRRKGVGFETAHSFLPRGELIPDGVKVIHQYMPIPYDITMELSVYSSNLFQRLQILEQILMLFDPDIQIQRSDAEFDWTKITILQLNGVTFEENYPALTDRRMIIDTFTFNVPIWITPPAKIKEDFVKNIWIRIGQIADLISGGEYAAEHILNQLNDQGVEFNLYASVDDLKE